MGVLEALGGWQNVNQEKLKQIKVDNPPLYDAISKALNLLAKKFGGEDIMIQRPIELGVENVQARELSDLGKSILLSQRRGTETGFKEIFESVEKVALQKYQLNTSYLSLREQLEAIEKLVEDGYLNNILSSAYGNSYILTEKGEEAVDTEIKIVPSLETNLEPNDEDLKLEVLLRMINYYDGGDYQLLTQDNIIFDADKQKWGIPPNKYFNIVVKLLQDGLVEKDPSGDTDSIRLTNKGYKKAMDWLEENSPEEGEIENSDVKYLKMIKKVADKKGDWINYEDIIAENGVPEGLTRFEYSAQLNVILSDLNAKEFLLRVKGKTPALSLYNISNQGLQLLAPFQPNQLQESILEAVKQASETKVGEGFVSINEISGYNNGIKPLYYDVFTKTLTTPSLQQDLAILYTNGYLEFAQAGIEATDYRYRLSQKGNDFLDAKNAPAITQAPQYDLPQHRLEGVLKRLSEAISKINDYVTISDLYSQLYDVVLPVRYTKYGLSGEPTLEKDLEVMEGMGLVKSRTATFGKEYYIDTKGSDMLTQLKFEEAQQQKASSLRPSPTESATSVPTGTIRFGNDGNEYRVTMTKSGVKRWTKRGEIPSDEPEVSQEPPISEITEDEVDLDLLEQQLNDDSLEFDLNEEDLDNLEF
jgi:predicted transcriptional regulator